MDTWAQLQNVYTDCTAFFPGCYSLHNKAIFIITVLYQTSMFARETYLELSLVQCMAIEFMCILFSLCCSE